MSQAFRQRNIYYRKGRKKVTGFREKPVLSFHCQSFLYPISGKFCSGGREPQFICSQQLGSYGHVVERVSLSGGHIVLRKWHHQGKTGCHLKVIQGNVATVISSLVCQVTTMSHILTTCYEPFLYSIGLYFHHQSHPQLGVVFALNPSLHSFWCYFYTDLQ